MISPTLRPLIIAPYCLVIDWAVGQAIPGPLTPFLKTGLAAAIGNFDGVHLGHQTLISAAVNHGHGLIPAVITFRPHPRRFFNSDLPGFALADDHDKLVLLSESGVKVIIRLTFDEAMRQTSATDFISTLLPSLGVKAIYAGEDFAFGNARGGGMDMMQEQGQKYGITAHQIPLEAQSGEVISSSRIRQAIAEADMATAAEMLGRPNVLSGIVTHGDKRGRTIGFPTANVLLGDYLIPPLGVYAVAATFPDYPERGVIAGVANIGVRPTVAGKAVRLEANLFDVDLDLYDQRINVFCLDFIRPEQKFDNLDDLRHHIAQDVESARAFHAKQN